MTGSKDVNLDEFAEYLSASGDPQTCENVRAALEDEANPLSVFLRGLRENDMSFLTLALSAAQRRAKRGGSNQPGTPLEAPRRTQTADDVLLQIQEVARPYVDGERPIGELHNRDLVERVCTELIGDPVDLSADELRQFLLRAGRAVGELIADEARTRVERHAPVVEPQFVGTALASRDTTLSMSAHYPRIVLARQGQLEKLSAVEPDLAEVYVLHYFAGRTIPEIAVLTDQSQADIAESLEVATVEVCLNDQ